MTMNRTFWTLFLIFLTSFENVAVEDSQQKKQQPKKNKFSIEELMNSHFPSKVSSDIDVDPCKADGFYGDIALPNINYELELEIQKLNQSYKEELEKYQKEILLQIEQEGLQIEEEGLLEIHKAKQKHDAKIRKEQEGHKRRHQNGKKHSEMNEEMTAKNKKEENKINSEKPEETKVKFIPFKWKNSENSKKPEERLKQQTKPSKKQTPLDDDFDQIEPKYFPRSEEFEQVEPHYIIREDETDSKIRIQNERERRIKHTGDPITLEYAEMEKMQNSSGDEHFKLKATPRSRNYDRFRVDMIKDENFAHRDLKIPKTEKEMTLEEKIRLINEKEMIRIKEKNPEIDSKGNDGQARRNSKRKTFGRNRRRKSDRRSDKSEVAFIEADEKVQNKTNKIRHREGRRNRNRNERISKGERKRKKNRNNKQRSSKEEIAEPSQEKPRHDRSRKSKIQQKPEVHKLFKRSEARHPNESDSDGKLHLIARYQNFPTTLDLSKTNRRATRAATARKERVWDYGVIPYEIDGNFSGGHKALFKQAMRHWENFTCVRFVERSVQEHPNYIIFTERPCGCCSFVGKRGNGPQAISIGKNCDKFGIVVHELGHVVGFWHEHTRPDRDNHVQIVRENIMGGQEYNFNKLNEDEVNSLGLPYDYDSIMHYARNTFSKGTYLDTIQPLDKPGMKKRPEIGQRIRLSEGDIAQTNLVYKCYKCGRTFQENSATFSSPPYGNFTNSQGTEKCEWRITATHGEKIVLNITEMDIYKSEGCKTDYLEIRDGYWQKSPVLAKLCGKRKAPEIITSVGSRMLVTYAASSKMLNHKGFTATYEAVCGGEITLDSEIGHLESPNFPDDYQPNKECVWKLTAPDRFQIALKFQSFEVENHDNCVYDYVEIRDGHAPDSKVIGTYCGYKIPEDVRSNSNQLLVKFVSDGSVQKAGFSASFMIEFDECMFDYHGCEHKCINTWGSYECQCKIGYELHSDGKHCEDACGGVLETSNGTITSPSFPEIYPGNKKCIWEIVAPHQYKITLNFTHFDLEGNNIYQQECEYDKVEVHSKMSDDILRGHGVFCGSRIPPTITSESNSLRIEFTSDYTVQKSGFAAVFFTDMDECAVDNGGCQHECQNTIGSYVCSCHNGFTLHENGHDCKEGGCKHHITTPTGQLQSPNFPDYYPAKKDCVWQLITTPGHRIKLIFNEFELEPHQECAYDHIVLYDGDSPDAHTLGRFCGSKIPHNIIATGNQMYMVFKSDPSVQRKGFLATHTTVCGGHLQATSRVKHFYSHAKYGDHNYDDRADCDWSIEAAPGRNVHLTFLTFEIEDEQDCGYDFVEVFSGLDDSGSSYGRFCGISNPTDIFSVTEALVVRFRSDDSINFKGFSAAYVATDPIDSDEKNIEFQDKED